ncbi:MAG: hypothetical protein JWP36_2737 [Paucimonas sp.]|nr:hypothetical protein [Paucimonas sp.]
MADSTLDPDNFGGRDRKLGSGHGTRALGPSDNSDSGSDIMGTDGLAREETLPLDTGTNSDLERSTAHHTAGPDVGDADLSSDTDSMGTGEHATAGRDTVVRDGADIGFDQIQSAPDLPLDDEIDESMDADKDPGWRGRQAQSAPRPPSGR